MHQTFYIDIDEEITSIVDRLRKAIAGEVVIVVPKRALLIQSIVNLKLLKKEADNLGKEIILVTQDKLGKMLVEKAGISVEQKLDDISGEDISEKEDFSEVIVENPIVSEQRAVKSDQGKGKIESMGSDDYFDEKVIVGKEDKAANFGSAEFKDKSREEKIVNRELVTDIGVEIKKVRSSRRGLGKIDMQRPEGASMDIVKKIDFSQKGEAEYGPGSYAVPVSSKGKRNFFKKDQIDEGSFVEQEKEDRINKMFRPQEKTVSREKFEYSGNISKKSWKVFVAFGTLALLTVAIAASYMFLPKATIKLFAKTKNQAVDVEIKGDANQGAVDLEKGIIPAQIVTLNDELSKTFDATGSKSATNQRAHGTVTIYNEYSNSPQPLVATTRLETSDGKIFRLTKGVTVPGTTVVSGETKPGAIEAEVMADESGEQYNIGPTKFTIPGFKDSGSEKYSKFYAESFKSMIGGGSTSEEVKVISSADVNSAKTKVATELNQILVQKVKDSAGPDMVVLDDAVNLGDANYFLSNAEGEATNNFTATVKVKAVAIVFNRNDFKNVAMRDLLKDSGAAGGVVENSFVFDFGKSDVDFNNKTIKIRSHVAGKISPDIDLENLKKGALGKSEDQLMAYLRTFSNIERAEIEYWPSFISGKIPNYESRVTVILDNN